jgi:hypothetical protein
MKISAKSLLAAFAGVATWTLAGAPARAKRRRSQTNRSGFDAFRCPEKFRKLRLPRHKAGPKKQTALNQEL